MSRKGNIILGDNTFTEDEWLNKIIDIGKLHTENKLNF